MTWQVVLAVATAVAALGGAALWLWDRRQREQLLDRVETSVDAEVADLAAEAARQAATEAERRASLVEEDARRDPPNSDLDPDDVDGRLLRAAEAAGGPEARARLQAVLDAQRATRPES